MAQPTFFYDQQIRRFLLQFVRVFSHFEVEYGYDDLGAKTYLRVPIRYGDASRQAQAILQDNSANNMPSAPQMSFYITDLNYRRSDVQNPTHVDKRFVRQREFDEGSQTYEELQGNAFTVERVMPVPYELKINLDIWTSNTSMKFQLLEQIMPLFNPSLEIQSTDNYLDWTSLSVIEIDGEKFSSRTIPSNDGNIDIATLKFKIPIWISPPARVTKGGIIHKIIASIFDDDGSYVDAINNDDLLLGTRIKITPHGYQVLLLGDRLRLLPADEPLDNITDLNAPLVGNNDLSWFGVINEYGTLNEGITQIRLETEEGTDIIGTVELDPTEENVLIFSIDQDTLSSNTMPPIDAVIDPLSDGPDNGLVAAAVGQRYLLTEATGSSDDETVNANNPYAEAWKGVGSELVALKNDIIEFNGTDWNVTFSATGHPENDKQYVTNMTTGLQYKTKDNGWVRSYEGVYPGGDWAVIL